MSGAAAGERKNDSDPGAIVPPRRDDERKNGAPMPDQVDSPSKTKAKAQYRRSPARIFAKARPSRSPAEALMDAKARQREAMEQKAQARQRAAAKAQAQLKLATARLNPAGVLTNEQLAAAGAHFVGAIDYESGQSLLALNNLAAATAMLRVDQATIDLVGAVVDRAFWYDDDLYEAAIYHNPILIQELFGVYARYNNSVPPTMSEAYAMPMAIGKRGRALRGPIPSSSSSAAVAKPGGGGDGGESKYAVPHPHQRRAHKLTPPGDAKALVFGTTPQLQFTRVLRPDTYAEMKAMLMASSNEGSADAKVILEGLPDGLTDNEYTYIMSSLAQNDVLNFSIVTEKNIQTKKLEWRNLVTLLLAYHWPSLQEASLDGSARESSNDACVVVASVIRKLSLADQPLWQCVDIVIEFMARLVLFPDAVAALCEALLLDKPAMDSMAALMELHANDIDERTAAMILMQFLLLMQICQINCLASARKTMMRRIPHNTFCFGEFAKTRGHSSSTQDLATMFALAESVPSVLAEMPPETPQLPHAQIAHCVARRELRVQLAASHQPLLFYQSLIKAFNAISGPTDEFLNQHQAPFTLQPIGFVGADIKEAIGTPEQARRERQAAEATFKRLLDSVLAGLPFVKVITKDEHTALMQVVAMRGSLFENPPRVPAAQSGGISQIIVDHARGSWMADYVSVVPVDARPFDIANVVADIKKHDQIAAGFFTLFVYYGFILAEHSQRANTHDADFEAWSVLPSKELINQDLGSDERRVLLLRVLSHFARGKPTDVDKLKRYAVLLKQFGFEYAFADLPEKLHDYGMPIQPAAQAAVQVAALQVAAQAAAEAEAQARAAVQADQEARTKAALAAAVAQDAARARAEADARAAAWAAASKVDAELAARVEAEAKAAQAEAEAQAQAKADADAEAAAAEAKAEAARQSAAAAEATAQARVEELARAEAEAEAKAREQAAGAAAAPAPAAPAGAPAQAAANDGRAAVDGGQAGAASSNAAAEEKEEAAHIEKMRTDQEAVLNAKASNMERATALYSDDDEERAKVLFGKDLAVMVNEPLSVDARNASLAVTLAKITAAAARDKVENHGQLTEAKSLNEALDRLRRVFMYLAMKNTKTGKTSKEKLHEVKVAITTDNQKLTPFLFELEAMANDPKAIDDWAFLATNYYTKDAAYQNSRSEIDDSAQRAIYGVSTATEHLGPSIHLTALNLARRAVLQLALADQEHYPHKPLQFLLQQGEGPRTALVYMLVLAKPKIKIEPKPKSQQQGQALGGAERSVRKQKQQQLRRRRRRQQRHRQHKRKSQQQQQRD
jgi:hypothetical protein